MLSVLLLAACGGDAPPPPPGSANPAALSSVPRPETPSDAACPRDGTWKACALEERIGSAGMMIKPLDSVRVPQLPRPGARYKIGKVATMAVFYFPDSAAGVKATAGLDPYRLTPRGDSLGAFPAPPREVIRSANLIAVLFDVNATQAERVRLAITAGAPRTYPKLLIPGVDTVVKLPPMTSR
jgi:hypothetical protein